MKGWLIQEAGLRRFKSTLDMCMYTSTFAKATLEAESK